MGHRIDTVLKMFEKVEAKKTETETRRYIHKERTNTQNLQEQVNRLYLKDIQGNIIKLSKTFKGCEKGF